MAKLLKEISVSEMLEMRDSGMTNREIAKSLGISYAYVLKLIGKQPKELTAQFYADRKHRGAVISSTRHANRTSFGADPEPEAPAACLMVENNIIELVGTERGYILDMKAGTVEMVGGFKIDLASLPDLIAELTAIHRKTADRVRVPLEAW